MKRDVNGTVSLTLQFDPAQWEVLGHKSRLEGPGGGNTARYIEGFLESLACDDGYIPLLLPSDIVNRLSEAGGEALLADEGFHECVAIKALRKLLDQGPKALEKFVLENFTISPRGVVNLSAARVRWEAEDKLQKLQAEEGRTAR